MILERTNWCVDLDVLQFHIYGYGYCHQVSQLVPCWIYFLLNRVYCGGQVCMSHVMFGLEFELGQSVYYQRLIENVENCYFQSTGDASTQLFNTTIWLGCLLFRAANVFPCAHLVNMLRPANKQIPINHQKALWFSGKLFIHVAGNNFVGFKPFWQILFAAQASGNGCSSLIVSLKCFWLLLVSKLLQESGYLLLYTLWCTGHSCLQGLWV